MDVSVVATIGSFVVSERVLRPKATILVIMGCVLLYDLKHHTDDAASLRVYRGPGLIAFTLMLCAYSLRMWRRNGVACDELLFLPGTPFHDEYHSNSPDSTRSLSNSPASARRRRRRRSRDYGRVELISSTSTSSSSNTRFLRSNNNNNNNAVGEGDAAGGFRSSNKNNTNEEMVPMLLHPQQQQQQQQQRPNIGGRPPDQSISSSSASSSASSFQDEGESEGLLQHQYQHNPNPTITTAINGSIGGVGAAGSAGSGGVGGGGGASSAEESKHESSSLHEFDFDESGSSDGGNDLEEQQQPQLLEQSKNVSAKGRLGLTSRTSSMRYSFDAEEGATSTTAAGGENDNHESSHQTTSQEHHHPQQQQQSGTPSRSFPSWRLGQIGKIFFFRTTPTAEQQQGISGGAGGSAGTGAGGASSSSEYAPSGPSVFGAALDMSLPISFNYHIFIEASNHLSETSSGSMSPKMLPLIFFSILLVRSMVPPSRRLRFWSTVKVTALAPLPKVFFRDAFVGDVMTSFVLPMQDILFGICYYVVVLFGWISGHYSLDEAGAVTMRQEFIFHTIFPIFALLPLWWKFLQCLRASYDARQRWPHLGDALKYVTAAMVIVYSITHGRPYRKFLWVSSFLACLCYQIWWDTFMDWKMLEILPRSKSGTRRGGGGGAAAAASSAGTATASAEEIEAEEAQEEQLPRFCCVSSSGSPSSFLCDSFRPSSFVLLTLQQKVLQPMADFFWRVSSSSGVFWKLFPTRLHSLDQIQLRSRRLYKTKEIYWNIFCFNVVFRFTWMLCFILSYSLTTGYAAVFLAILELIRRCLWGILKLEMETIEMTEHIFASQERRQQQQQQQQEQRENDGINHDDVDDDDVDDVDNDDDDDDCGSHAKKKVASSLSSSSAMSQCLPQWLDTQVKQQHKSATAVAASASGRCISMIREFVDEHARLLFFVELCVWGALGVGLCVRVAHL